MNAQTVARYLVTHRDKTLSALGKFIAIDELNGLGQPPALVGVREGMTWANEAIRLPAAFNSEKAVSILRQGISSRAIEPLSDLFGVGKGDVAAYLDLDRTTALRRANKDQALPMHAAEGVLRLLELEAMATDTFESDDAAHGWLRRPHPMLEGECPLEAAKTSFGTRRVKDMLIAIKYGGVV
ncbi:MAG: antitoxin Xre/MbcA/ParS toxin-binding domain-containing protein [Burkholderiaceae bacterium]